jgi:hypothetical protein
MSDAAFRDFQNSQGRSARRRASLVAGVVLEAPASSAEKVRVGQLGDTSGLFLGEASWPKPAAPKELPAAGDECVVAIDNRGVPTIVGWAIPNW